MPLWCLVPHKRNPLNVLTWSDCCIVWIEGLEFGSSLYPPPESYYGTCVASKHHKKKWRYKVHELLAPHLWQVVVMLEFVPHNSFARIHSLRKKEEEKHFLVDRKHIIRFVYESIWIFYEHLIQIWREGAFPAVLAVNELLPRFLGSKKKKTDCHLHASTWD